VTGYEASRANGLPTSDGLLRRGRIYTELVREAGGLEGQIEWMTTDDEPNTSPTETDGKRR
jgi:hypothetical protein